MSKIYFFKCKIEYYSEISANDEYCRYYKDKIIAIIDNGYNKHFLFSTLCYYLSDEIGCEEDSLIFIGEDLNIIPDEDFYIEQVLRYYRE